MKPRATTRTRRAGATRQQWLRLGLEELKFVRSVGDLKAFAQKAAYGLARTTRILARHTKVPHSLQIEPTNCCNVRCICCSREKSTRQRGYMDFDLFRKIMDDAAQIGVRKIRLYLHGEPMLHPQIVEMVRHVKLRGLAVHLVTNGMLFAKDRSEAILRSGVTAADRIIFSILGHSKEVHEKVMRKVSHERVIRNLFDLLKTRRELGLNGPAIETIFYAMPENEAEKEDFYAYWHGVVDHVQIVETVSRQFSEFKGERNGLRPVRTRTCTYLWDRMTVFWNGDVATCMADLDGVNHLGNVGEQSITEVWNCERSLAIKNLHKNKQFEQLSLCGQCDWQ